MHSVVLPVARAISVSMNSRSSVLSLDQARSRFPLASRRRASVSSINSLISSLRRGMVSAISLQPSVERYGPRQRTGIYISRICTNGSWSPPVRRLTRFRAYPSSPSVPDHRIRGYSRHRVTSSGSLHTQFSKSPDRRAYGFDESLATSVLSHRLLPDLASEVFNLGLVGFVDDALGFQ